jgi:hypothetical protein
VYPNPVQDLLYVKSDQPIQSIVVIDNLGRKVVDFVNKDEPISLTSVPSGVYLLSVKTEDSVRMIRIIKN